MRIHLSRSIVPNLFTVLNIFFGFLCVIYAAQGKFTIAGWYIVLAGICDTLDGLMARLTKSASEFGVELDSLADVVSFGAAPAYLLYALALKEFGAIGTLLSASQLIFGALRLARFNVQLTGFEKSHFVGLPIPLSALTQVTFVLFMTPEAIRTNPLLQQILLGMTLVCGLLMVSTIRYPVLPKFSRASFSEHPGQAALLIAAGLMIVATKGLAIFPVLVCIVLSGVFMALYRKLKRLRKRRRKAMDTGEDEQQTLGVHPH